mmetsp:Transcript_1229/g.4644  ORF Transcript_1229/g.4644 Transcript_1229/m.4644 type:complete len:212 (-) Transcript_1229:1008-1643(-)
MDNGCTTATGDTNSKFRGRSVWLIEGRMYDSTYLFGESFPLALCRTPSHPISSGDVPVAPEAPPGGLRVRLARQLHGLKPLAFPGGPLALHFYPETCPGPQLQVVHARPVVPDPLSLQPRQQVRPPALALLCHQDESTVDEELEQGGLSELESIHEIKDLGGHLGRVITRQDDGPLRGLQDLRDGGQEPAVLVRGRVHLLQGADGALGRLA